MPATTSELGQPSTDNTEADHLPRFAVGHMALTAGDVQELTEFYTTIGMRPVVDMGRMAIVELRGGTHIVIRSGPSGQATLDFIVDDIDETHSIMAAAGARPSSIRRGSPHDSFDATDPEGNTLAVHSSHAIGPV